MQRQPVLTCLRGHQPFFVARGPLHLVQQCVFDGLAAGPCECMLELLSDTHIVQVIDLPSNAYELTLVHVCTMSDMVSSTAKINRDHVSV